MKLRRIHERFYGRPRPGALVCIVSSHAGGVD